MGIQVFKSGGATVSAYLKLAGGVTLSSSLVSVVDQSDNVSPLQLATASAQFVAPLFLSVPAWTLGGARSNFILTSTVASAAAGANVYKMINNVYTINNTAAQTGTITGIFQNVTETNLNGITHNLMDLQVGGVSAFRVTKFGELLSSGYLKVGSTTAIGWAGGKSQMFSPIDGVITLNNNAATDFLRLQLGGTTSSFPAIKRNGAAIDFRLADDSAYCGINATNFVTSGVMGLAPNYLFSYGTGFVRLNGSISGMWVEFNGSTALSASAIFGINSTTQGFLMPRMTQAQILLITLPANGLMVYNTDINTPCFYDGGALLWKKVSHSNM